MELDEEMDVIAAVPERKVDFATLAIATAQNIVLVDRVDVSEWSELTLLTNVFQHSLGSGAGSISIAAYAQSLTDEDPTLPFNTTSPVASISIGIATPTPAFITLSLPLTGNNCMSNLARIVATGSRTALGALSATIAVVLSGKRV